ncbi:hypothetical protein BZG01_19790 [Labilibaculum manganireducens]|uniref:Transmembrane protein n=1 Tax=Labilibaculum manganireducens TaxID=1940525 RepID=A0A2N3HT30_9BACT|nr:hypothetical protein BZG01_19790 [Labilibaculum manganireducens]
MWNSQSLCQEKFSVNKTGNKKKFQNTVSSSQIKRQIKYIILSCNTSPFGVILLIIVYWHLTKHIKYYSFLLKNYKTQLLFNFILYFPDKFTFLKRKQYQPIKIPLYPFKTFNRLSLTKNKI